MSVLVLKMFLLGVLSTLWLLVLIGALLSDDSDLNDDFPAADDKSESDAAGKGGA